MLLLALEAAGPGASAALGSLATPGRRLAVVGVRRDAGPGAGDRLVARVAELLDEARVDGRDLSCLIVDRGPGSFTGVRVAVAAARALALATGRPLVAFTRFDLLAAAAPSDPPVALAVVLRAGRDRVLVQAFDPERRALGQPQLLTAAAALEGLARPLRVIGSGATLALGGRRGDGVLEGPTADVDAAGLLELAASRMPAGLAPVRPFELEPMYPRPPDAVPPRRLIVRGDDPPPAHARAQA